MKHGTEFDRPEDVTEEDLPPGVKLRDHVVDGIREYDQRLPRWWLMILFGVIFFSIIYWVVTEPHRYTGHTHSALERQLAEIERKKLANSIDVTDDSLFVKLSQDPALVDAGKATYESLCVACHGKDLQGGIGFNLVDSEWVHGSRPSEIYATVAQGVITKGMPAWEGQLGQQRVAETVAYILSKNPDLQAAVSQE